MLRFAKSNGTNNDEKDQLALSSDDEDEGRSRSRSPSWGTTPEPYTERQHQHLSPPSPEDRTSWSGLTGLVAKGTPKSTTSPPMSFSDAVNKAKAAVKAEKAREGDAPCAQTSTVPQPRGTEGDIDEEEERVEPRMPGSFAFGDHDCGVAGEVGEGTDWVPSVGSMLSICSGICGSGRS